MFSTIKRVWYGSLLNVLLPVFVSGVAVSAKQPQPIIPYLTASSELFSTEEVTADSLSADGFFRSVWVYAGLPSVKIAGKKVFSAFEIDVMHREVVYGRTQPGGEATFLQRYGLFGGVTLFDSPQQKGMLMVGSGIAATFSDNSGNIGYVHLIYDHRFILSGKLTVGLGVVAQYHFDSWRSPVNLLPTVKWQLTPASALSVAWDNLQFTQAVAARVSAVGEVRYDLSFFKLRNKLSYELETAAAGGGCNIRLGRRYSLRLRYFEMIMHREIVRSDGVALIDHDGGRGRSFKVVLVKE